MKLITSLLLTIALTVSTSPAQPLEVQNGVIIQKIDKGYIFIFPATQGRIQAIEQPAGKITVGKEITVKFALKVMRGRARFIGLDASPVTTETFEPKLKVEPAPSKTFGFMIEDKNQPLLKINIKPSFMQENASTASRTRLDEKIAREGNLTVIFGQDKDGHIRVVSAILD